MTARGDDPHRWIPVAPTWLGHRPELAPPRHHERSGRDRPDELDDPHSFTSWPAATVRAGTSPEGLPIDVQRVAGPWRDDVALAGAQRIERELGPWPEPAL